MTDGKNHGQITDRQLFTGYPPHSRQRYDEGLKPLCISTRPFFDERKRLSKAMPTIKFVLPLTKI